MKYYIFYLMAIVAFALEILLFVVSWVTNKGAPLEPVLIFFFGITFIGIGNILEELQTSKK